jgi:hypothetical protein
LQLQWYIVSLHFSRSMYDIRICYHRIQTLITCHHQLLSTMERRTESVNTLNSLRNDSIFQDTKLHHLKFLKQVQQTRDDLKLLITENQFVNQLLIIVAFINLIWLLIILLFLVQENVKLTLSVFLTVLIKEVPSLLLI